MCLGVPMKVVEIDGFTARCEARGIERKASLFLMQHENIQVGDMVMIHVGHAIQKMTEEEAQTAWDLFDEMFAAEASVGAGHARDDFEASNSTDDKKNVKASLADDKKNVKASLADDKKNVKAGLASDKKNVRAGLADDKKNVRAGLASDKKNVRAGLASDKKNVRAGLAGE